MAKSTRYVEAPRAATHASMLPQEPAEETSLALQLRLGHSQYDIRRVDGCSLRIAGDQGRNRCVHVVLRRWPWPRGTFQGRNDRRRVTGPGHEVLGLDQRQLREIRLADEEGDDTLLVLNFKRERGVDLGQRPFLSDGVGRHDHQHGTRRSKSRIDLLREVLTPADVSLIKERLETGTSARLEN